MMTILSIDSLGGSGIGVPPVATQTRCQPQGGALENADVLQMAGQKLVPDDRSRSGLEELVSDNEILGMALQSLVESLDRPKPVVADEAAVVVDKKAVGTPITGVKPEEFVVENLLPATRLETVRVEKPVVDVTKPVVVTAEAPAVAASIVDTTSLPRQTDETPTLEPREGGVATVAVAAADKPTIAVDVPVAVDKPVATTATPVVIVDTPAVVAEAPVVATPIVDTTPLPRQTDEAPTFQPREGGMATVAVADKPTVTAEKPTIADAETPDGVVLQAVPVGPLPGGEARSDVLKATDDMRISAVSRTAPVDVSDMFLAAAEEVAAAVKVSPALMRGEAGEIRVQLRPDVLEGAEVVVAVDGKKMEVTFVPTVTHVADTLAANQMIVQQQLVARIAGFEVSVSVAQTVATNVSVGVASSAAAQAAVARTRRTNGRA